MEFSDRALRCCVICALGSWARGGYCFGGHSIGIDAQNIDLDAVRASLLFNLQSLCLMHTGKPKGVAVSHCMAGVPDTANPHYVSDPLPQSFAGSL